MSVLVYSLIPSFDFAACKKCTACGKKVAVKELLENLFVILEHYAFISNIKRSAYIVT